MTGLLPFFRVDYSRPFRTGQFDFRVASQVVQATGHLEGLIRKDFGNWRFGVSHMEMLGDKGRSSKFAVDFLTKGDVRVGGCLLANWGESMQLSVAVRRAFAKSEASVVLHTALPSLGSEVIFGFERNFIMSRLCVGLSGQGILTSVYSRSLDANKRLSFSGQANLCDSTSTLGISLQMQ
jgi:hypothetical protein